MNINLKYLFWSYFRMKDCFMVIYLKEYTVRKHFIFSVKDSCSAKYLLIRLLRGSTD